MSVKFRQYNKQNLLSALQAAIIYILLLALDSDIVGTGPIQILLQSTGVSYNCGIL